MTSETVRVAGHRLKYTPPNLLDLDPSRPEDGLPIPWPPPGADLRLGGAGRETGGLLGLDPARSGSAAPAPWPPPRGLDPEQDPFARRPKEPGEAASAAERSSGRIAGRSAPAPAVEGPVEEVPVPLLALDLEEAAREAEAPPSRWGFTQDRAVALSIVLHLLLALLVVVAPQPPKAENPDELPPDLLGLNKLWAIPPQNPPIPVQFYPAPGPKASAPGPNPRLSDLDRRAGGGDPRLPKAETPKSTAGPGIQDLDPGRPGPGRGEGDAAARAAAEAAARAAAQAAAAGRGGEVAEATKGVPTLKGLPGLAASPLQQLSASDAARAAEGGAKPGGGDEGGGWESQGGFVDSGPLSFDTKGYDWGAYAAEMIRKIKRNWEIPKLAHYGMKGRLVVRFYLMRDGRVEGLRLLVSSGIPPYDNASMQAIRSSNPFRPLPADFPNPREGVTITFLYNIRPEDDEAEERSKAPPPPLLPR